MEVVRSVATGRTTEKSPNDAVVGRVPDVRFRESPVAHLSESEKKRVAENSLKDAVEQANTLSVMFDRSLKFEYRKEADMYQVSVIDTVKDEVVRKIPPDEVVRFIESIKDMFGALLDVQA